MMEKKSFNGPINLGNPGEIKIIDVAKKIIELTNSKSETASVKVVEHINGDWVIIDPSHDYIKEDASTIHFLIDVDPGKKEFITYTYRKEWK